ncbi:MAG: phosphotransferase, partial [Eubacteriales bacterium]|nr:phosphotransferase [Eubacteriales bacterium]
MAVKTMLSMEQIRALCAPYGIGEVLEAVPIERGSTQTNYLVTAQSGKYVLRLYENRTKEQAYFELETLAVLSAKGYPCPKPRVAQGAVLGGWEGKSCALFHFLPGEHAGEWTDGRRLSAARAAAWLVLLLNGFRPETTEHRWNYGPELCERLAREYARRYDKPEKLKWYLEELAQLELPESLPMSVCHAD